MKILAFDTSTDILSLCLLNEGEVYLTETARGLKHAETLLPAINALLTGAGLSPSALDLLVCARGPGSFTGLRIGMATAKGLSEGTGVPFLSIDTLDALAYGHHSFDGVVIPVIDAKKARFYTALYTRGARLTDQADWAAPEILKRSLTYEHVLVLGPGTELLLSLWGEDRSGVSCVTGPYFAVAHALARLGMERFSLQGPDVPEQGPVYIRSSDAELSRKKIHG